MRKEELNHESILLSEIKRLPEELGNGTDLHFGCRVCNLRSGE